MAARDSRRRTDAAPGQRIAHFSSAAAPFAAASIPSGTGDAGFSAKLMALASFPWRARRILSRSPRSRPPFRGMVRVPEVLCQGPEGHISWHTKQSSPPQMAGRFAVAAQKPTHLLHLEHFSQVKARRNDPSVDGAQIPPNSAWIATGRSTCTTSSRAASIQAAHIAINTWIGDGGPVGIPRPSAQDRTPVLGAARRRQCRARVELLTAQVLPKALTPTPGANRRNHLAGRSGSPAGASPGRRPDQRRWAATAHRK